jgi:hypothetical protein
MLQGRSDQNCFNRFDIQKTPSSGIKSSSGMETATYLPNNKFNGKKNRIWPF